MSEFCALIEPPKRQGDITQSLTKLAPKREAMTGQILL